MILSFDQITFFIAIGLDKSSGRSIMIKRVTFGVRILKDKILPVFATRISQMLELQNDPKIVFLKKYISPIKLLVSGVEIINYRVQNRTLLL